jgi:anti-sigma factor ChrR (cupin superfamily)
MGSDPISCHFLMTDETLNGDLGVRVTVSTADMPWSPSPSPGVWRKRLHRVGPAEAGQVTSIVRYDANSDFHAHEHPDGEEILVLEGVFTDDRGDWPAGTYLLNPEGYSHAPSSRDGCVLFVKLRQFPGLDRQQVAIDTGAMDWEPDAAAGIAIKPLYSQDGFDDTMRLERWQAGTGPGQRAFKDGAEIFVIEGAFSDEAGRYEAGSWIRLPAGASHRPQSAAGCTLYIKEGGFSYLL